MAQGYYSLEEAARILQISEDELKMMARRGELRSFQDRGTWRFRVQDIEELARQRGLGSDPDLALGEPAGDDEFTDIGREDLEKASSRRSKGDGPRSPQPDSDSDVRLVGDSGEDDFGIELDPDTRLLMAEQQQSGSSKKKIEPVESADSGVDISPAGSDADVRIVDGGEGSPRRSDSDVRLEFSDAEGSGEFGSLTEEIDLDAEQQKFEQQQASPFELEGSDFALPSTGSTLQADSGSEEFDLIPEGEASSPLEISSDEFELALDDSEERPVGRPPAPTHLAEDAGIAIDKADDSGISLADSGSDEFALLPDEGTGTPPKTSLGEDADSSSSEFALAVDDSSPPEVPKTSLGEDEAGSSEDFIIAADDSDSSEELSLLQDDSSSEFEISLDSDSSSETVGIDSSSEFELALDEDVLPVAEEDIGSSSEFDIALVPDDDSSVEVPKTALKEAESSSDLELALDAETSDSEFELQVESDSEFDLTIDDDEAGTLALDQESAELEELPDLESGSEVVALDTDTDLESSDFDMELEELESSSEVVALDDESLEDDFDTFGPGEVGEDEDFGGGIGIDDGFAPPIGGTEEEEEPEPEVVYVEKEAAPWGALPVALMLPCVVILFITGLMGLELLQSLNGYREPGIVTQTISSLMGRDLTPK